MSGDPALEDAEQAARSHVWAGVMVEPGSVRDVRLEIGESFTGTTVRLPFRVIRGEADGPTVFVSAAVHGDEINGTGAIRTLMLDPDFRLKAGTLVLIPVVNIMGFERHSRYSPDRRDLNRSFPGSIGGSITGRLAYCLFQDIISRCDFGIDLHTAAIRRTNFPNLRGDLKDPKVRKLAESFGGELVVDNRGPLGSLRREACKAGCPVIILEAGEPSKVEPAIVEAATRGIRNCLIDFGMIDGTVDRPSRLTVLRTTRWVRASTGGFLQFHCTPGEMVEEGQPVATNFGLLGDEREVILAPLSGIVLGMTTMPAVTPGDPVAHIARPHAAQLSRLEEYVGNLDDQCLATRLRGDLATNMMSVEHVPDDAGAAGS
jgi:hypothetical protein